MCEAIIINTLIQNKGIFLTKKGGENLKNVIMYFLIICGIPLGILVYNAISIHNYMLAVILFCLFIPLGKTIIYINENKKEIA